MRTVWLSRGRTWPISEFQPGHHASDPAAAIHRVVNSQLSGNEPVQDPHGAQPETTIQCHRVHGRRAIRAGMSVVIFPV